MSVLDGLYLLDHNADRWEDGVYVSLIIECVRLYSLTEIHGYCFEDLMH